MAKRDGKTITLGSGKIYLAPFANDMPTVDTLCVDDNLLGLDVSADQHSYERDYDKFRFHGFSCVSSLIAAIVPIFCCRSRNGFFFSLLDS